jgi:predicted nuclease with RNAse H fold
VVGWTASHKPPEIGKMLPSRSVKLSGMHTIGIDLSAETRKTAVCSIHWEPPEVRLHDRDLADEGLVELIGDADLTGIDSPFGWPDDFVRAISAHTCVEGLADWASISEQKRRRLRLRATDRYLHDEFGLNPLSVSTSWLGSVALRAAWLQARCIERGLDVDRSGLSGILAEVYPGAALRYWNLLDGRTTYKGNGPAAKKVRERIVQELQRAGLRGATGEVAERCVADDDEVDALVCALVARAVVQNQTVRPFDDLTEVARREGWIHMPTSSIADIVASRNS